MPRSLRCWLWAALAPAAFLALDPGGLAPFGPSKWFVVSALAFGAISVGGDAGWRVSRGVATAWGAVIALAAIAAIVGADPMYSVLGTPERHFGVIAWVLCFLAFIGGSTIEADESGAVMRIAVASTGIVGLWALAESLGWEPLALVGVGDRVGATFGSSAYLGAAMALAVPLCIGHARRRWAQACAVLALGALVSSGARAAWVGVLVAACLVWFVRGRVRPPRAVAAAVVAVIAFGFVSGAASRVPDLWRDGDGGARGRVDEWRVAVRVVADHPLTGTGPEGYRIAFPQHVDDAYERAHGRAVVPDRAHNALLDVAATLGIPGVLAYLALLSVLAPFLLRTLRSGSPELAGAAAGVVGYFVQSLFLFPIAELEPVVWLLAGIVVADGARVRARPSLRGLAAVCTAVAVVAGAADVVADRRAKSILDAPAVAAPTTAAALRPDALRYRLVAARAFEARGSLVRAREQVEHALDVSPRDPVARSERARLLLARARQTGDPREARAARDALLDVARTDPRNAEVWLRLGVARQLTDDAPGAIRAWRRAEYLAPRSSAASINLAVAYAAAGDTEAAKAAARRALRRDRGSERAREILDGLSGT